LQDPDQCIVIDVGASTLSPLENHFRHQWKALLKG